MYDYTMKLTVYATKSQFMQSLVRACNNVYWANFHIRENSYGNHSVNLIFTCENFLGDVLLGQNPGLDLLLVLFC